LIYYSNPISWILSKAYLFPNIHVKENIYLTSLLGCILRRNIVYAFYGICFKIKGFIIFNLSILLRSWQIWSVCQSSFTLDPDLAKSFWSGSGSSTLICRTQVTENPPKSSCEKYAKHLTKTNQVKRNLSIPCTRKILTDTKYSRKSTHFRYLHSRKHVKKTFFIAIQHKIKSFADSRLKKIWGIQVKNLVIFSLFFSVTANLSTSLFRFHNSTVP